MKKSSNDNLGMYGWTNTEVSRFQKYVKEWRLQMKDKKNEIRMER